MLLLLLLSFDDVGGGGVVLLCGCFTFDSLPFTNLFLPFSIQSPLLYPLCWWTLPVVCVHVHVC